MSPCAHCGQEVPAAARFCPQCGATQSSVLALMLGLVFFAFRASLGSQAPVGAIEE